MSSLRAPRSACSSLGALLSILVVAGCSISIVAPSDSSTVPAPVVTRVTWNAQLQPNSLRIVLDPMTSAQDLTSQFAVDANAGQATASLAVPPGNHELLVNGSLWSWYSQSYSATSARSAFSVHQGQEKVNCFVFDAGYANIEGPSDAIFINGQGQACIPDGAGGRCRQRFGRCTTADTGKPVYFNVFDDQRGDSLRGPTDAVYIPSSGASACQADQTATGACRRWFGEAFTSDGRRVACNVFDDGYTNMSVASDAVYVPHPIPSTGAACIPDGTVSGTCHKWFGRCSTMIGTPITYTMTVSGPPGSPSGQLGSLKFGGTTGLDVVLVFTFEGNTANVVPFYVPTTKHAVSPGIGFMTVSGKASITVKAASGGSVLAQADFLPIAGIFVSIDNGNRGVGFGSLGALPPDPHFPSGGVEVAYPYARFLAPVTDLRSNYTTGGFGGSQNAITCVGFNGSPGTPAAICNQPPALGTTSGVLILNTDVPTNPQPSAEFTAVLH